MADIPVNLNFASRSMKLFIDQEQPVHVSIVQQLQARGAYELETQMFLMRVLRSGDTFVDVGAHIGYFSLLAASIVGEDGKVVAVEPTDENYARLQQHIDANELNWAHAEQCAISDNDGDVTFYLNADNDGGHALWDPQNHPANEKTRANPQSLTVPGMTLQTLLQKHEVEHVRLMKIDTEGAEPMVLAGARDLLSSGVVDFIIAEVNNGGLHNLGHTIETFFALCRELGFVLLLPDPEGKEPHALLSTNRPDPKFVYNIILARPSALGTL